MVFDMSRIDMEVSKESHKNGQLNSQKNGQLNSFKDEIVHLTRLRSRPRENLRRELARKKDASISTMKMIIAREANYSRREFFSSSDRCHIMNKYLPIRDPMVVDKMPTRAYVSHFTPDGSLFIAAFQGRDIRIYDVDKGWKVQKNIQAHGLNWTVTDTSISSDQSHLVYATMSPIVHIVDAGSSDNESIEDIDEVHEGFDFSSDVDGDHSFGIFTVNHSNDGREIVGGSSDDAIYVFDLEARKLSLRIPAHASDVNTVCFGDETGNIMYSGSDDNLCKVWDRRCLRTQGGKSAGVLTGHLEGITFIDSHGDGRYFISNGKDQSIKLWDIRKMSSNNMCANWFRNFDWDYRWMDYPAEASDLKHPNDQSLATYKGHSVLRTLVRSYISPAFSTGQKYIYTGSHDKCVYVYDLVSGEQVTKLEHHRSTVRDCSWHPYYPMLVSSSWDGDIVKWEFKAKGDDDEEEKVQPIPAAKRKPRRHIPTAKRKQLRHR
ncbi:unnamed protein product [Cuscuta epithymum]|uniref:LEC14B homolog n=1 Tax=Cuscuta epithymum TaxID=186058 RepID=A0AAV0FB91_9ASTE|nr:unnamed protein product [Cuscuta epithymum]